ncbi:hypothetical protein HU200_060738 [Digitaria exilis]|uniref:BHLH domain-containing protein n=1 Tax=Digitaria exilis TaxID=1010633 RepID=A0A835A5W1_9POAL|nr:hypothetical protein HU200_060738 [Digitaria exilis]
MARPIASLSPEDLGDTEWYYMLCMTYTFQPGQGLPGRSFASNEHIWLCNAHLADSKAFPRALLAKTIVCIPLMGGVLELGTTDPVLEDPDLVSRATASFWEMQLPTCSEEPRPNPSANDIVLEDLDIYHNATETIIAAGGQELGQADSLSNASLEHIAKEIDEFYALCTEMDVQPFEDNWILDGSFEVPSSLHRAPGDAINDGAALTMPVDGSRATSFITWTRLGSDSEEVAVPVIEKPQKLLKKAVAGGAWENNGVGGTTRTTQESGMKNHAISERRRREKLNELFLILKSLVPCIRKVDKASILAKTIAYVKELQRRVQELESSSEPITRPSGTTRLARRHDDDTARKESAGSKRKGSELGRDIEGEHPWVLSKDSATASNVTVTVSDKDVLMEVQCQWEELLMTRVFDAIKGLHLDVLSVQASAPEGFMGLNIRAQFAGSAAVAPWMISEALRKTIGKR